MYNRDYEEYMKTVLGYKPNQEVYNNTYNNYDTYNRDYSEFYPEIYNKLDPIVTSVCSMNTKPINQETIDEMINAIVTNVNLDEYMEFVREEPKLKNGDVRNPNVKENSENRQRRPSRLLRDLLRILILNKLFDFGRPRPRPPFGGPNRMSDMYENVTGNKYPMY